MYSAAFFLAFSPPLTREIRLTDRKLCTRISCLRQWLPDFERAGVIARLVGGFPRGETVVGIVR